MNTTYNTTANDEAITQTVEALKANGFNVLVVEDRKAAKETVLGLIPEGSDAFTNTSVTLDETGISDAINNSDAYVSVRNKMMAMYADPTKKVEMKQLSATPSYALGSVHALTQDGKLMIASASGSQMPGESYGAEQVVFVVGSQKIVKDMQQGLDRIETHVVPLEDERARAAYGSPTTFAKLLILNRETIEGRTTVVIIKESIGF